MNYLKTLMDLYRLKKNVKLNLERMRSLQDGSLRKLLRFSWEHSAYYRTAFQKAGLRSSKTMKKFCILLCLMAVSFSMAACGNNGMQAQMPAGQAETPTEERRSLSEVSEESENEIIQSGDMDAAETDTQNGMEEGTIMNMNVQIGDAVFSATLEENEAVTAFVEMMRENSVVIQMSDYSGFEKVGPLGTSLPVNNSQTTTHAGDIVLYNGNQIVIFYGSNSWSYTRLGHIDDLTGWEEALGNGDVTVTFSLE